MLGSSPFKSKQKKKRTLRERLRENKQKSKKKEEICEIFYVDLDKHILGEKHVECSKQLDWSECDIFMAAINEGGD